jgi:hypothetical protein
MSSNSSSSRIRKPSLSIIIIKNDLPIDMNHTPSTPPGSVTSGGGGSWAWGYNKPQ